MVLLLLKSLRALTLSPRLSASAACSSVLKFSDNARIALEGNESSADFTSAGSSSIVFFASVAMQPLLRLVCAVVLLFSSVDGQAGSSPMFFGKMKWGQDATNLYITSEQSYCEITDTVLFNRPTCRPVENIYYSAVAFSLHPGDTLP